MWPADQDDQPSLASVRTQGSSQNLAGISALVAQQVKKAFEMQRSGTYVPAPSGGQVIWFFTGSGPKSPTGAPTPAAGMCALPSPFPPAPSLNPETC